MNFLESRFGANGFEGEHLWLGHLGHFFIVVSFAAAFLAFLSFAFSEFNKSDSSKVSWLRLGRMAFTVHGISVIGVFILLFVMIFNHWFEYHYAWRHSSKELPVYYIISSFWEGQEGSFLLWQFWLVVLGWIGIRTLRQWEAPVLSITALTQFFLGSMVLGIYVLGHKIGSNPFVLLRNEMSMAPIFQRPNYLQFIADGNGLNPLLQNYWMVIHPPVLFCGFASVLFPFAFAIAALLRNDYEGWVKPALPWALFSIGILGTGILMGGAWAYESLSFGGFWAWDPVENMSFVPWLFVVAGLHLHVVYRYTKHSLFSAFLFYILGFAMVLYSTFLTRSGILGDTSVHAFTDLGMTGQLLIYMFVFLIPSLVLLFARFRSIPNPEKEEALLSREFWMFIGSLLLLFSAVQQVFTTSIPVWNILFHDNLHWLSNKIAPPTDVVDHYNRIQIIIALLVALGTGAVQFISYKVGNLKSLRYAGYAFLIAIPLTVAMAYGMQVHFTDAFHVKGVTFQFISFYVLFLFSSVFSVLANCFYLYKVGRFDLKLNGGTISHLGFSIFLIGVLFSQGQRQVISLNTAGVNFGKEFSQKDMAENILMVRDSTYTMGKYKVTYTGTQFIKPNTHYIVHYSRKNDKGEEVESFDLQPNAQVNQKMGMVANPDTKHYLTSDVFTHVSSVPDNRNLKDTVSNYEVAVGDTFFTNSSYIIFEGVNRDPALPVGFNKSGKVAVSANLKVKTLNGLNINAEPVYVIDVKNSSAATLPYESKEGGVVIDISKIDPVKGKFSFSVREHEKASDFIIMKAIIFPYINLVWFGGIITFLGVFLSMWKRREQQS
ncbi:MAG: cytochrome c biogenesis protein CcsA [Chitinophagales bacterium]